MVKQGQQIKQGDPLVKVDIEKLHTVGKSSMTMIVFPKEQKVELHEYDTVVTLGECMALMVE